MSFYARLVELLHAARFDGFASAIIINKPFSISAFQATARLALYQERFATIIDVGANVGQFAVAAARRFPDAKIYAFEPVPDVFEHLKANVGPGKRITAFNCALGSTNGVLEFYRNAYTQVSSAYRIAARNRHPNYDQEHTSLIHVKCYRLDEFAENLELVSPLLLKIDAQGMEIEVLRGSESLLSQISHVLLEVPFEPLYENQADFEDLHEFMKLSGYHLAGVLGSNEGRGGKIIEADLFYERRSHP